VELVISASRLPDKSLILVIKGNNMPKHSSLTKIAVSVFEKVCKNKYKIFRTLEIPNYVTKY
jgi:hypothetical protein